MFLRLWLFFFFKQKTAYDMRISDWSSDVCSSDLSRDEVGVLMTDVEVDIVEPRPLDLVVIRARDDVARREFGARVIIGHVAVAGNGVLEEIGRASCRDSGWQSV